MGLIPAYAGKTLPSLVRKQSAWAHPRVCGENTLFHVETATHPGSSPRMRGKLRTEFALEDGGGLIPAYAGKTRLPWCRSTSRRAHPRVCGENCHIPYCHLFLQGSSPRMRGKPQGSSRLTPFQGLIPAYAGKTTSIHAYSSRVRAHPRVCGENFEHVGETVPFVGSSPRMRGKPRKR